MVRDLGERSSTDVVEHYIDIPPSAHAHRVQVSSSPKKHIISVERYDLQQTPAHADKDETSISDQLAALTLRSRLNGPLSPSQRKRETTPSSDVFVMAAPSPAHPVNPVPSRTPATVVNGDVDDGTPVDEEDYIPVHLRWVGRRRDRASYAVPREIRELYPPDSMDHQGWKERKYYVVIRGYEIGIFYDFWGHIKPFGFAAGAMSKGFDKYESARDFWHREEEAGHVKILHRSDHN